MNLVSKGYPGVLCIILATFNSLKLFQNKKKQIKRVPYTKRGEGGKKTKLTTNTHMDPNLFAALGCVVPSVIYKTM